MTANAVQKLYVAYFNRPADTVGLNYWVSVVNAAGGSTTAVSAAFASSAEYAATYAGLSTAARVDAIYTNLFGRSAEPVGLTYWSQLIESGRISISNAVTQIAGGAQGADLVAYNSKVSAAESFTTALNTTAEIVGYSGTTANNAAKVWLSGIRDVATQTAAVVPAVLDASVATVVAASVPAVSNASLVFTTTIDALNGGAGNDTFIGDANTVSAADQVVGGTGTDTLKLYGNTAKPSFSGIENLYLEGNTAGFDTVGSGITSLALVDPTTAQTYSIGSGQAVSLATMAAGEAVTFTGNTVSSLSLELNSVAASGADVTLNLSSTALTSLALSTTGAKSQVTVVNAGGLLSSVTVSGNQSLELGHALTTITSINASASTGAVDVDTVGASTLAFTGGAGNDRINMVATLAVSDTLVGGAGTDTVAISDADTLTALTGARISGFEVLEATTGDATAYDVDFFGTSAPLTGILVSSTGAATTVSNINSGAVNNIRFTADTPTSIALTGKSFLTGTTSDAATVILDNSVDDNADGVDIATTLTFTNVDRLTVQATSDATTAARAIQNSIDGLTATDLDTLIVTGNAAVSITLAATTAALGEIDASGSTGKVTTVLTAAAIANLVYRGNSTTDTFTASDAASNNMTMFTGGGSDVLVLGVTGAAHVLNFNATDFTTGDVKAGDAITINTGAAFQAADTVTLNFSAAIEGLLKTGAGGTALSAATANVTLVGTSFSATTNVIAIDGGNNTTLQFDLNGDGAYTAAADFSIEILGLANNTLNYIAATDVFTFTATA